MEDNKNTKDLDFGKKLNEEFAKIKNEIKKPNILIAGATGVGKSSLINKIFGKDVAVVGTGKPVTQTIDVYESEDCDVRIFDSKGYELGTKGDEEFYNNVVNIARITNNPEHAIHMIWYCIAASGGRVQEYDIQAIEAFSKSQIPVAVVFTKVDLSNDEEMQELKNCIPSQLTNVIFETTVLMEQYNQSEQLIEWSINQLPESLKYAFIKSQLGNIEQKWQAAHKMIGQHCSIAFGVGFTPIPMADAPLLVTNELALLARILYLYNLGELKDTLAQAGIGSLIGSLLSAGGKAIVANLIKLIPSIGSIVGGLISGTVASIITAAFGEATSKVCYEISKARLNGQDVTHMMNNFGPMVRDLAKEYFKSGKKADDYTL